MVLAALDRSNPVAENVDKMAGPAQSGVTYLPGGWLKIALAGVAASGFLGTVQNPYQVGQLVDQVVIDITTGGGTTASTVDIDIAGSATQTGDSLLDGFAATSAVIGNSLDSSDEGSNGGKTVKWAANGGTNDYITVKETAGRSTTGLVGALYIHVIDNG